MRLGDLDFPASAVAYMSGGDEARGMARCEFLAGRVAAEFAQLKEPKVRTRAKNAYAGVLPWLPDKASSILDIGCGLGGIDVLLARHYGTVQVHLMDGDGKIANRAMGYRVDTQAWADVRIAEDFVRANVSPTCVVVAHVADPKATIVADLIVSFKSWCHHYPVGVYLDLVKRSLRPGGTLIVDIRSNTEGRKQLVRNGFRYVGTVESKKKCDRVVFTR